MIFLLPQLYTSRRAQLQRISWLYQALNHPTIPFRRSFKSFSALCCLIIFAGRIDFQKGTSLALLADHLNDLKLSSRTDGGRCRPYAIRGGIVDIFSPAHDLPVRIERFG